MDKFTTLTGVAAPLPMINVDTDMIFAKQFLTTVKRTGLADTLFHDLRHAPDGTLVADFVLNKPAYAAARILIAGANFGCGSSREHAPWALLDFGIRCLIAPSFADIFYGNCFKNGMLPVVLAEDRVARLMTHAEKYPEVELTVDLERQSITGAEGPAIDFEIEPFRKKCLLEGLDDIAITLTSMERIEAFEWSRRMDQPWLVDDVG